MTNRNNDSIKVLIGLAIGTAVGAAIAYFSDNDKRNKFVDDVTDASDRMREGVKDAYYEARIRGRKARRDLSRYIADLRGDANDMYDDVVDKASRLTHRGKEYLQEVGEEAAEKVEELAKEAKKEVKK